MVSYTQNYTERGKYLFRGRIDGSDFLKLPQLIIDTPIFSFDSHQLFDDAKHWTLSFAQKHGRIYGRAFVGTLKARLVYNGRKAGTVIHLRPLLSGIAGDNGRKATTTAEDVMRELNGCTISFETMVSTRPKSIYEVGDDALLAELQRRQMLRVGEWRPKPSDAPVRAIGDVINLDDFRRGHYDPSQGDKRIEDFIRRTA